ncbi:NUDIX hydrolase [Martelella mediterranea]|uniref:8-oxo-dGTP pyrophosphatase MutT (NUDIX family) n=1 Tax=Martelella mediterranea TaxID=293089 RepID=A0A4R3NTR7_9HYPH|nr:NUDIX hydrolase [Martelella mediterranea]TCT40319.1 8-oxo-dGTP pyrophosphatase MutT (NUDIX family) [Martelella mediterranea]
MIVRLWKNYIAPLMLRPPRVQIAALCYRQTTGGPEVLLITSRTTKRWILPKGWPINGTDGSGTALQEAWEEAGVKEHGDRPIRMGRYRYKKIVNGSLPLPTDVYVYAVEVHELFDAFPEMSERERQWMSPQDAAEAVDEPQLKLILKTLPERLEDALQR